MMSALPATARPLLSPRSSCSWLIVRQSGASNGVAMLNSPHSAALQRLSILPENVLHDYSHEYRETATEKQVTSDQALVRASACAIVDKLNSGEVTPLDLLDVLEQRVAEVESQVNALPTLAPILSTKSSGRRETRGILRSPPPALLAVQRSRSRPVWPGSRMARTWADRCVIPRASAAWSACDRASAALRIRRSPRLTVLSACRARWRATSRTLPCCWMR